MTEPSPQINTEVHTPFGEEEELSIFDIASMTDDQYSIFQSIEAIEEALFKEEQCEDIHGNR